MASGSLNVFKMIAEASLMVQFVMLLLLFFSIMSWTIIFIKYRYIRRAYLESDYFMEVFWDSRDFAVAFEESEHLLGSPLARIFRIGYAELRKLTDADFSKNSENGGSVKLKGRFIGTDNIKRALRRAINSEVARLTQMVPFLATTGNTAPFIGLFGTVWGIMHTFHGIGMQGSASLAVVAPGISEALVATAAGLAVAIPSVIAFNHFMSRVSSIESEMQSFSADFLNIVERDILRVMEN